MNRYRQLLRSSVGNKFVMALSGILMLGFLVGHLSGNLLVFSGEKAMNAYAAWLQDHGSLLWGARIVLLACLGLHVSMAVRLWLANRAARPERYRREATLEASWASRQMVLTGLLVAAYLVYHLLHYTFRVVDTGGMELDADGHVNVYRMVVTGFQDPLVTGSYIVAMLLLGLHLIHAVQSLFQTLGWNHPAWNPIGRFLSFAVPVVLVVGFLAIPLAALLGRLEP